MAKSIFARVVFPWKKAAFSYLSAKSCQPCSLFLMGPHISNMSTLIAVFFFSTVTINNYI